MTNADRIVAALRHTTGLTDAELVSRTGVTSHQQVNSICRRLAKAGVLRRERDGGTGHIRNVLVVEEESPVGAGDVAAAVRPVPLNTGMRSGPFDHPVIDSQVMVVIPCSATKSRGGELHMAGPRITDLIPVTLGSQLVGARREMALEAGLDERLCRPAWQRYAGALYSATPTGVGRVVATARVTLIVSGAYGLVHAEEPIGIYDRPFSPGDWQRGLLERCIRSAAQACDVHRVLALCARTTGYAELIRRVTWPAGVEAMLVTPVAGAGSGAQVMVPRAIGEALGTAVDGGLPAAWRSTDGVALETEVLT